jgi:hypothetical protein
MSIVERDEHARADMGHDVLAQVSARIGKPVWKLLSLREEEKPCRVVDEGRDDDDLSLDCVVG